MKKFLLLLFIILLGIFSYIFYSYVESNYYKEILDTTDDLQFDINFYSIFGTHLNIEGCINKKLESSTLVLKNKEEEITLDSTFYEEDNNTCFYINENYNEGIYLDDLKEGNYVLLVKDKDVYYTLKNNTDYKDLEYYTITKDNSNNKININFKEYKDKNYVNFVIKKSKLPEDVYDITIDPGHGGNDVGAIGELNGKEYYEANLTLEIALLVKEELEDMGLKVKLTREKDEDLEIYNEGGRALLPNEYNTKYSFSIHFNSFAGTMNYGGVEIYIPNDVDLTLASMLADNLSEVVGYSKKRTYKVDEGVYFKYFTEEEIIQSNSDMEENNMKQYNIKEGSPYMYMIREVGGIHTSAYIDGRNDYYGINNYYNSNQTAEPYLLELAYINYPKDLKQVLNNSELFSKSISSAIGKYLNIS